VRRRKRLERYTGKWSTCAVRRREEREEKENKRNTCMLASARWMIPFGFIDYRR
jgi:hypothetical protein